MFIRHVLDVAGKDVNTQLLHVLGSLNHNLVREGITVRVNGPQRKCTDNLTHVALKGVLQVGGNLKMEIGHAIVMFDQKLPDLHRMFMPAVKGAVHKFYLCDFLLQKKCQFFFHPLHIPEPQRLFHRRKTVAAPERTPSARFIIDDAVPEIFDASIAERNPV